MKKLYFLNEDEKHRILNLHESATKKQYLTEAINRNDLVNQISKICTDKTYGEGNFTEDQVTKNAELMKRNFPLDGMYKSNASLQIIADNIESLKHIDNYCKIVKKYKEIGGKTIDNSLLKWINNYVYDDNAWTVYIKTPFDNLIKNSTTTSKTKEQSDVEYSKMADTAMAKGKQGQVVSGIGKVLPSVKPEIESLLSQAGIQSKELDQATINKLYDYLKS